MVDNEFTAIGIGEDDESRQRDLMFQRKRQLDNLNRVQDQMKRDEVKYL